MPWADVELPGSHGLLIRRLQACRWKFLESIVNLSAFFTSPQESAIYPTETPIIGLPGGKNLPFPRA